jgi:hypothetical protein
MAKVRSVGIDPFRDWYVYICVLSLPQNHTPEEPLVSSRTERIFDEVPWYGRYFNGWSRALRDYAGTVTKFNKL